MGSELFIGFLIGNVRPVCVKKFLWCRSLNFPNTTRGWIQPSCWNEVNALWLWELFPSVLLHPVIVLLHYRIVSGVVVPQSRHWSRVYGGRLTWHINCYLPRWMELAREQMRRAVTWHCFWQTLYIPSIVLFSSVCAWCQLSLPLMSYWACQTLGVSVVCVFVYAGEIISHPLYSASPFNWESNCFFEFPRQGKYPFSLPRWYRCASVGAIHHSVRYRIKQAGPLQLLHQVYGCSTWCVYAAVTQ